MTETFAQLFEASLKDLKTRPGSIIRGIVTNIGKGIVIVDAGLKSESAVPIEEFRNNQGELEIGIGDEVDMVLDAVEDGFGETQLSREKAKRHEAWLALAQAYEKATVITGLISGKVKGGFTVEINGIRAFLPGSLVEARPVRDTAYLEGKELEFKVIKLDQKRNNVVVSRRAVLESENSMERDQLLDSLQEGMIIKGVVKNLTKYGAFIDLGGVDGLLHITDMGWNRVKDPSECVAVGDDIQVKVLKFDRERTRVSLGLKQLSEDPWIAIAKRYPVHSKLIGRVTNLTEYGCFVEIEEGVEGLVHVSEMDWTNKNIHPHKVVAAGDKVEVVVLDIDEERRRISLGLKQCKGNPWQQFCEAHSKGDRLQGKIKSITDFGIFIGLEGGIDGLVHLSDISWDISGEEAVCQFKKGDEIEAVLLQVDVERERISLGMKQLVDDPFNRYLATTKKGEMVTGSVTTMDAKNITLSLTDDGVSGRFPSVEVDLLYAEDKCVSGFMLGNKSSGVFALGSSVKAKYIGADRKNRIINLTVQPKDETEDKTSVTDPNGSRGRTDANPVYPNAMSEAFRMLRGN